MFPDSAVLPSHAEAGAAGVSEVTAGAGQGASGGAAEGGAGVEGGAGPMAGAGAEPSGAGGAAGCLAPERRTLIATGDTWIEALKPAIAHGNDKGLYIAASAEESRALLSFTLPAAPAGTTLVSGSLSLRLESNADAKLSARSLEVHALLQPLSEARATWNNWGNGSRTWDTPGGDFGPVLSALVLAESTADGSVTFDLTSALAAALSTQPVPLPLIILEVGPAPTSPAELAFTSREGDASGVPSLSIEYCLP